MLSESALLLASFLVTFLSLPHVMKSMEKKGIVGRDAHKNDHPMVPEMGGVSIVFGLVISSILGIYLFPEKMDVLVSFVGTILVAGTIGFIDDLKALNARVKPVLTAFAGFPILYLRTYVPRIQFPFIGMTRLTRVYPILLPIVMAVTSNAVNMMDPFNGVMAGSSSIITLTLLISAIIIGNENGKILKRLRRAGD